LSRSQSLVLGWVFEVEHWLCHPDPERREGFLRSQGVCDPRLAAWDDVFRPTAPLADRLGAAEPQITQISQISLAGGLRPPSGRL